MATEFSSHDTGLKKPIKARGKAKRRSAKELEAMTSPDALRAVMKEATADWKKTVARQDKNLLEAEST